MPLKEERRIQAFKNYFVDFISGLSESDSRKIFYVLEMLKMHKVLSTKFVKSIENGIFELRAESEGKIFRVFFIYDEGNKVILLNGFQKQSQKTPRREIRLAKRLKHKYFYEKGK